MFLLLTLSMCLIPGKASKVFSSVYRTINLNELQGGTEEVPIYTICRFKNILMNIHMGN